MLNQLDNFSPVNSNYLNYDIQRNKLRASLWNIFSFSLSTFKSLMVDNRDEDLWVSRSKSAKLSVVITMQNKDCELNTFPIMNADII